MYLPSYLTCALESEADAVDAYGLNVYSWCDAAWHDKGVGEKSYSMSSGFTLGSKTRLANRAVGDNTCAATANAHVVRQDARL